MNTALPDVDLLVSRHPAQSESEYTTISLQGSWYSNSCLQTGLPRKYLPTRFKAISSPHRGWDIILAR